jgi:tripartite-type tricarboxylate transporter receptor subunit TctC
MSRTGFRVISLILAFCLANTVAVEAQAQDAKRFVVGTAAGSGLDRIARNLATQADLKSAWGAYIVIDNQPGANGLTAADHMRKLPPDGSALLVITVPEAGNSRFASAPSVAGLADFVPIAYLGSRSGDTGKFWYGVFGLPGTPSESARRLEAAIQQAMRSTELTALTAVLANTLNYQQDRPVSAAALAQALRASALAAGAGGATAAAGVAQPQSNVNAAADDPKVTGGVFRP